jgi:hypothetical protein
MALAQAVAVGQTSPLGIVWTEHIKASLPIALNLALRIVMVILLAAFGLRRAAGHRQ